MFDIPLQTHIELIEPVSGTNHLKFLLINRFLSFLNQIGKSSKYAPKQLLKLINRDTRSVTDSNLRNILLLTDKDSIEELNASEIDKLRYND